MSTVVAMNEVAIPEPGPTPTSAWHLRGRGRIDDRPAMHCTLTIRSDGSWSAEIAQFTLANDVDLFFEAVDGGGHFCGPAFVKVSRADTHSGLRMGTVLTGTGPLLVVKPGDGERLALESEAMVDGEVVE